MTEPFNEGKSAFIASAALSCNPYPLKSKMFAQWAAGYLLEKRARYPKLRKVYSTETNFKKNAQDA